MSKDTGPFHINSTYVRLRPDATAEAIAVGPTFWEELSRGALGTFQNEYLVTTHSFGHDWPMWEMHPNGDEFILLLSGAIDLVLEKQNGHKTLPLRQNGEWALVPKGIWHTGRVNVPTTVLFITAGEGTLHRQVEF